MFNLIKKAATGSHKIQQDSALVLEDFSKEFERQLAKIKPEIQEDILVEPEKDEMDDYIIEELRQQKRKLLQDIKELEQRAEDIIAKANNTAKDIELEAKKKGRSEGYELGQSQGSEKGYREGLEEGLKQSKAENEELLKELKRILESTEEGKQEILKRHLEDLKDISVAVAEKVVHVSLKSSGDIIKRMILSATEGMSDLKWVKIYIAETDSQMLVKVDKNLIEELSQLSNNIKVIVMPEEESGTCIIELPNIIIDASTKTQIENIRDILSSARR